MALQTHYAIVYPNQDFAVVVKPFQALHLEYLEYWGWCEEHGQDEYENWPMGYISAQAILAKMNAHRVQGEFYRLCTDQELKDAQNG